MNIEPIWYEGSPYVYAGVGAVSLSNYQSYIAIMSGVVLLTASVTIIRMRWTYRRIKVLEREKEERIKRAATRSKLRRNSRLLLDVDDEVGEPSPNSLLQVDETDATTDHKTS
jgi:hypothetical protein